MLNRLEAIGFRIIINNFAKNKNIENHISQLNMLGTLFYILGLALFWGVVSLLVSLIPSKSKWVEKNFPKLAERLSEELNLEITNKEVLIGITIGPEKKNHIILGKYKNKLSVKYLYNVKILSRDIIEWEYEQEQPMDEIILSIKKNIDDTQPLQ